MKKIPTYSVNEIKQMVAKPNMDVESLKILANLIDEEIELYDEEDMGVLIQASMILFTKSLLIGSIKNLK